MNDLFIGGGGYSGTIFVGALEYLHEKKLLDLKNLYCCSIGSLIGALFASGINPKQILNLFLDIDLNEAVKYNISNIGSNNCLMDDSFLETLIKPLLEIHSENITLSEFAVKTGVNINIYTTNITTNKYVNLNNKDYPEIGLKDAIKASMSIPFLFQPVMISNELYIDGCCKNIYGAPPDDVYIHGYCIYLNSNRKSDKYFSSVFYSIINAVKPRGTFLIECLNETDHSMYLNLSSLKQKPVLEMYKKGINYAKHFIS
jgi:NTE family protein